jgi:hypothetical protein
LADGELSATLSPRGGLGRGSGAAEPGRVRQAAWEQVGEVLAAERALSLARLSRDVLGASKRHLAKLAPGICWRCCAIALAIAYPRPEPHGQMATYAAAGTVDGACGGSPAAPATSAWRSGA